MHAATPASAGSQSQTLAWIAQSVEGLVRGMASVQQGQQKVYTEQQAIRTDLGLIQQGQQAIRTEQQAVRTDLDRLQQGQQAIRTEQQAVRTDLDRLQQGQQAIRTEQQAVSTDLDRLQQGQEALRRDMNETNSRISRALGGLAEGLERSRRRVEGLDKEPRPAKLVTTATELLELLRTVGLRYNIQGLVQAVLEGHRGVRAKRRLLQQQLEKEARHLGVTLPASCGEPERDDWRRERQALLEATSELRQRSRGKKRSWDSTRGQLLKYYTAAAKGESELARFLADPEQDALLLSLVAAMAAGLHSEVVEFNAAPVIKLQDRVAIVDLLEIKMYPTDFSEARKQLVEQAAIISLALRRAVLPDSCSIQVFGRAVFVLERPSAAQLRSLHGRLFALQPPGGPWELEGLQLHLQLRDE